MPTDCKGRLDALQKDILHHFMDIRYSTDVEEWVESMHSIACDLHAELLERCETMERMTREPLWLTVSSGNPMIHFVADPRWIWSSVPEGSNDEK